MDYFWSRNKGFTYGAKREGEEEEERGNQTKVWKLTLSMDSMIFGMDITWKVRIIWILYGLV